VAVTSNRISVAAAVEIDQNIAILRRSRAGDEELDFVKCSIRKVAAWDHGGLDRDFELSAGCIDDLSCRWRSQEMNWLPNRASAITEEADG
jgi:hypothetical protein